MKLLNTLIICVLLVGALLYITIKYSNNKQPIKSNNIQLASYGSRHFWYGDIMSIEQVCKTWGAAPLDTAVFKKAHNLKNQTTIRAKMACSLLKNQKQYIGKTIQNIIQIFGPIQGHYFNDFIPAYIISPFNKKNPNSWQIVFLIDRNQKIAEIIVHKNCCYKQ